jgi:ATP adenylyltransferase
MPYVEQPKPETGGDNVFARLPLLGDDRAALIVWRGPSSYLLLNKFPYNAGHLLAVPYREVAELADLTPPERTDLFDAVIKGQAMLGRALQPDGYNIGINLGRAGGAGLPGHLHVHIVPRWNGDSNFMPVIADTKVLPVALDALWERLRPFAT